MWRASLWSGTAASWVDLSPEGSSDSIAFAISGGQQVGYAFVNSTYRASLWSGTAASWVDLSAFRPPGFTTTFAQSISSDGVNISVAGYGFNTITNRDEALLWTRPICAGDFNRSGGTTPLSVQDIIDFLNAWFTGDARADFNGNGLSVQDIFDFLGAWFAGC